ncbi:MAG: hypothetical protein AB1798_02825 [Spirochaetota bacterium]
MKKRMLFFFIFLSITSLLLSESLNDFYKIVDFNITLKELDNFMAEGKESSINGLLILDGTVASKSIINQEETDFLAEIELVNGEWVGLEAVKMYKCIVRLAGPDFFARIPQRRTQDQVKNEIVENTHVLVIGKLIDARNLSGQRIPVVQGYFIRNIQ